MRRLHPLAFLLLGFRVLAPAAVAHAQSGPFPPPDSRPLPPALQNVDIEEKLGMPLPNGLVFTDENGQPVHTADLTRSGKPIVLVLAYYHCPMLCDLVLQGTVEAMRKLGFELGKDYTAVTISFDPRDRPNHAQAKKTSVLHALGKPEAGAHWPFLVGDEANVTRLLDAVGYRATFDKATDQYAHPAAIMVLTPDGRVSRYLYGVAYSERDLRFALIEASGGKIGSIVDRVIMSCYRYDPASRRYGLFVMGFLRIGSAAVLLALATMIIMLLRRERRRERSAEAGGRP